MVRVLTDFPQSRDHPDIDASGISTAQGGLRIRNMMGFIVAPGILQLRALCTLSAPSAALFSQARLRCQSSSTEDSMWWQLSADRPERHSACTVFEERMPAWCAVALPPHLVDRALRSQSICMENCQPKSEIRQLLSQAHSTNSSLKMTSSRPSNSVRRGPSPNPKRYCSPFLALFYPRRHTKHGHGDTAAPSHDE